MESAKGPNDFSLISLLPILSEILEKHLISDHLSEYFPLSNCQWGFQSAKSTVSVLLSTTNDWFQQLEEEKEIGIIFFDFCKAFDSVPHQPLTKLCQHGFALTLSNGYIVSYLANHKQSVVVNGDIDNIADVNLSDGSKLVLYADDILLYCPILLPIHLKNLQKDDDALQNYATANYLTFNVPKCKFMLVSRKKQNTNLHPSISVYGSPLDSTTTFKYLGLIIASHLSWTTHIDNICSKAKHILGLV